MSTRYLTVKQTCELLALSEVSVRRKIRDGEIPAVRLAREGKLSGLIFVGEISRWEADSRQFVRVVADFKLIRTEDGAVLWERRIQRAVPTPSATNLGQAYTDSVKEVVRDLFAG